MLGSTTRVSSGGILLYQGLDILGFKVINTSVEFLDSQLTIAREMYEKWSYGLKALDYLSSTTNNRNKTSLEYTGQQHNVRHGARNFKMDFPKRKYVDLPEYLICNFCGNNGRLIDDFNIKKKRVAKNVRYVSQIWVRKNLLEAPRKKKGPKQIWVPKTNK